jgi:hypothetical protein
VGAVRHHARDRLLLSRPYSAPLGLRLGLFRFPGPAPLGLAGGAMAEGGGPHVWTAAAGVRARGDL